MKRKILFLTIIQLTLGFVIVFLGWEILYRIVQPTSKNWMWILEMKLVYAVLAVTITISNFVGSEKPKLKMVGLIVQLGILAIFVFLRYDIYPHRSLFMLVANLAFIISVFPLARIFEISQKVK